MRSRDQLCGKHHNPCRLPSAPRASRALQGQSVQDCASFVSSSRNSKRMTTRSSPHAQIPGIVDTSKTKAQIWAKGRLTKEKKKRGDFYYRNISGEGIILYYSLKLIQKNQRRVKLQTAQFYINSKKSKSAPRQICNYFRSDGMFGSFSLCFSGVIIRHH